MSTRQSIISQIKKRCIPARILFICCFVLCGSLISAAMQEAHPPYSEVISMENGEKLYREGAFESAWAVYKELEKRNPENSKILSRLGELALTFNKMESAIEYLKQAEASADFCERLWLFSIQRNYSLAMAYYRSNNMKDAAAYMRKAAGPFPVGPFKQLSAFKKQYKQFDNEIYTINGPDITDIQFSAVDPLPVVTVFINNNGPYNFFIDTGGADVIIDTVLANELSITAVSQITGNFAGGDNTIGLAAVDSIRLSKMIISHVPVHLIDINKVSEMYDNLEIHGVIGTRLLMQFIVTIDYPGRKLVLRKKIKGNSFLAKWKFPEQKRSQLWCIKHI